MLHADIEDSGFLIKISLDKFLDLVDDSYFGDIGDYNISKFKSILDIEEDTMDLDSFVSDQILSILDNEGNEDESADNEFFENAFAIHCHMSYDDEEEEFVIKGQIQSF